MNDDLPSDAAFTAWLRSLEPDAVVLDRAAHATPAELRMISHVRQDAA
jgi:hypothetical protein